MIYEDISWSTVEWHRWKGPIPLAMINDGPAKWKGSILSAVKIYDSAVRRSQLFASMEPTFAHQVKDLQSQQQPDEEDKDKDWYKYKYEQRQKQHKNSLSDPSLIIGELPLSLTNWLTHPLTLSRLVWCDPGVWRCQLRTCWGCYCCWLWCWGSCWQQFVTDLGADVWS